MKFALKVLPIALIIIAIYFQTIGFSTSEWWIDINRLSFTGTDPNDFSTILLCIYVYSVFLVIRSVSKFWILLGSVSCILTFYSILLTLSRGGIITFLFATTITTVIFSKNRVKRIVKILILAIVLLFVVVQLGLIDLEPLYQRFFGEYVSNLSRLTAGRIDWWQAGIEAIKEKPLIGFGSSQYASQWLNFKYFGIPAVMHNIYIEILFQYGILGFFVFMVLILGIAIDFFRIIRYLENKTTYVYLTLVPFLSLAVILFAGLGLSWQWRELLWFLIPICLCIGNYTRNIESEATGE